METKLHQISFMEFLINENTELDDNLGQVIFPKGFEVRDLENLRYEFEKLANRYGLTFLQNLRRETLY